MKYILTAIVFLFIGLNIGWWGHWLSNTFDDEQNLAATAIQPAATNDASDALNPAPLHSQPASAYDRLNNTMHRHLLARAYASAVDVYAGADNVGEYEQRRLKQSLLGHVRLLENQSRYAEAIKLVRELNRLDLKDAETLALLARLYQKNKDYVAAVNTLYELKSVSYRDAKKRVLSR
jgi:hypothetical protein